MQGRKDDNNKPRLDLLPPELLFSVAEVLTFGAGKYSERNWECGMSWGRVFAALMRHMWAWWRGEATDDETGLSHLAHAGACLAFLIAYEARQIGVDDRACLPSLPNENLPFADHKARRDAETQGFIGERGE